MPAPDELNWDSSGRPLQYRANQVGIMEQLRQMPPPATEGIAFSLDEVFRLSYQIQRQRQADVHTTHVFDAETYALMSEVYDPKPIALNTPEPVEDKAFLNHYL